MRSLTCVPTAERTRFLWAHGTFTKTEHMPGPKGLASIFQRAAIVWDMFADRSVGNLEITTGRINKTCLDIWVASKTLLNLRGVDGNYKGNLKLF